MYVVILHGRGDCICKCGNIDCLTVLQEHDGADDLLGGERMHLLNLKRMLEAQLQLVQQQLQVSIVIPYLTSKEILRLRSEVGFYVAVGEIGG